jgi:phosphate transport system permease protein
MFGATASVIAVLTAFAFLAGRARAVSLADGDLSRLHSRPAYHGLYSALWVFVSGGAMLLLIMLAGRAWIDGSLDSQIREALPGVSSIEAELILSDAKAIASGDVASGVGDLRQSIALAFAAANSFRLWATLVVATAASIGAMFITYRQISLTLRSRNRSERFIRAVLWASAAVAVLTTIGIVLSLLGETLNFFAKIGWRVDLFLFGAHWSPLSGVQEGSLDPTKVGALPLFAGTLMITVIAMLVATPIGLFAAIYLSEFASARIRAWAKPMMEILAGVPTVVYGFFAAITMAPAIRGLGESIGLSVASESALAAGVVMGIMIIPFISSLSDDVINSVPQALRDGSYGLGATKAETIRNVVLPAALPGIVSAVLLGVSRAVGETMIVVMAAGQGANLTANPLEAVTTVTVQIVMLITGDTEAETAAGPAFTLGFTLFCITLALNIFALRIVRKYREMYD